jgi:hypothetical protein
VEKLITTKVGDEIIWLLLAIECPAEKKDEIQIRAETSSAVGIQEKQNRYTADSSDPDAKVFLPRLIIYPFRHLGSFSEWST